MGNYDDHIRYGNLSYAVVVFSLGLIVFSGYIPISLGVIFAAGAFPFTLLGALFPDVDHHASKPHKALKKMVFAGGTIGMFYTQSTRGLFPLKNVSELLNSGLNPAIELNLLTLVLSLLTGFILRQLVIIFRPKHRGITHRISTGIVLSGLLVGIVYYVASPLGGPTVELAAGLSGYSFMAGFTSHLRCDEILIERIPFV